jgi:O-antigen ligase
MPTNLNEKLLLIVLALTVGAAMLLVSARKGTEEGHRPWQPGSTLHVVTRLLNFDAAYPTVKGVAVKRLARGLGAAAALVIAAAFWYGRHRRPADADVPIGVEASTPAEPAPAPGADGQKRRMITPGDAAQLAMLGLVVWSFASALWAPWAKAASGESALLAMGVLWAVALGRSLSRRAATIGTLILVGVLTVTAILGVWYYYERNPSFRLKFPVGNPLFMAACLLPGLLLAGHVAVGAVRTAVVRRSAGLLGAAALAAGAMVPLVWALVLCESRGAVLGLAVGVWFAVLILIGMMRGPWRPVAAVLILAVGFAGVYGGHRYVRSAVTQLEGGRGATIRLRLYAWNYAWNLFLAHPALGAGQGGYTTQADAMSRGDAEHDPLAFAGERLAHAHNEWLETMADLGAVGTTLLLVAYGLSFWACRHMLRFRMDALEEWCFLGLATALAALIAEEATNVALRMPGLPVVWYTVLGLLWAMMRPGRSPADRARPWPRWLVGSGVCAAVLAAGVLAYWSAGDWTGALARARIGTDLDQQRWDRAQADAERSTRMRLGASEIVDAQAGKILMHAFIGTTHLEHVLQYIRQQLGELAPGAALGDLQQQDLNDGRTHVFTARYEAMPFLERVPGYAYVAGQVGRALVLTAETESLVPSPFKPDVIKNMREEGKLLLLREYVRDRFDAEAAIRCVMAWPERPVAERLDWLCTALRGGQPPPAFRGVLASLMNEAGFSDALNKRLRGAQQALGAERALAWTDPFAPEVFRLLAMAFSIRGDWSSAAAANAEAVRLYRYIRNAYPTLLAQAIAQESFYAFRLDPNQPARAVALARRAIEEAPPIGSREEIVAPIRESLIVYLTAGGDESEAAAEVLAVTKLARREDILAEIGYTYVDLAKQYVGAPPAARPRMFRLWVQRANDLVPHVPEAAVFAAQLAFEDGRDEAIVGQLRRAESLGLSPEAVDAMVVNALRHRPDSAVLKAFADARKIEIPTTAPATQAATMPTTVPSTQPGTLPVATTTQAAARRAPTRPAPEAVPSPMPTNPAPGGDASR